MGTPLYAAPELSKPVGQQVAYDRRVDVWSCGMLIVTMYVHIMFRVTIVNPVPPRLLGLESTALQLFENSDKGDHALNKLLHSIQESGVSVQGKSDPSTHISWS